MAWTPAITAGLIQFQNASVTDLTKFHAASNPCSTAFQWVTSASMIRPSGPRTSAMTSFQWAPIQSTVALTMSITSLNTAMTGASPVVMASATAWNTVLATASTVCQWVTSSATTAMTAMIAIVHGFRSDRMSTTFMIPAHAVNAATIARMTGASGARTSLYLSRN